MRTWTMSAGQANCPSGRLSASPADAMIVLVNAAREAATDGLVVVVLALSLVLEGVVPKVWRSLLGELYVAAGPRRRRQILGKFLLVSWLRVPLVLAVVVTSHGLSMVDVGLGWPDGDGLDYVLAVVLMAMFTVAWWNTRWTTRASRAFFVAAGMIPVLPTGWLLVACAVTVGVTDELTLRGLVIGAGARYYHLPLLAVVLVSFGISVSGYRRLSSRAVIDAAAVGSFILLYVVSDSVLLVAAVSAVWVLTLPQPWIPSTPTTPQVVQLG